MIAVLKCHIKRGREHLTGLVPCDHKSSQAFQSLRRAVGQKVRKEDEDAELMTYQSLLAKD